MFFKWTDLSDLYAISLHWLRNIQVDPSRALLEQEFVSPKQDHPPIYKQMLFVRFPVSIASGAV